MIDWFWHLKGKVSWEHPTLCKRLGSAQLSSAHLGLKLWTYWITHCIKSRVASSTTHHHRPNTHLMLGSTKLVLFLLFMLLVESSRIILHRNPWRRPQCLIKPLRYILHAEKYSNDQLIQCYSVLQQYAYNYWVGLGWVAQLWV